MKNSFRLGITALVGAAAAVAVSSCADPYYSTSVGGYYSDYPSYGYGHGYGGSSFSTSLFVSTGDPQWGYDPYTYSYYDYHRRAYYDPYLYGYYPVGYRPPIVIGVPHPYGWRPGHHSISPPRRITNSTLHNYRDREGAYRNSRYSWARQVRPDRRDPSDRRDWSRSGDRPTGGSYDRTHTGSPAYPRTRFPQPSTGTEDPSPYPRSGSGTRFGGGSPGMIAPVERTRGSESRIPRIPSGYNTPVRREVPTVAPEARFERQPRIAPQATSRAAARSEMQRVQREVSPPPRRAPERPVQPEAAPRQRGSSDDDSHERRGRGFRGLGEE